MKYYLAIDIGASSGRHILAHMQEGRIVLEEVYRFYNGMDDKDGHKVWNTERLFSEILEGMKKCKELGKDSAMNLEFPEFHQDASHTCVYSAPDP